MLPKVLIAIAIIGVVGYFLYNNQNKLTLPATETQEVSQEPDGSYTFEIVSLKDKPVGNSYVVVASTTKDVREQLPITVEYFKNGTSVWKGTIEGDASKVCRDKTGCGLDGPNIKDLNLKANDNVEMVAKGKDGTVLAKDSALAPSM